MIYEIALSNRLNNNEFILTIAKAEDEETAIANCLEQYSNHDIVSINVEAEMA